ncbi:hypothetical protein [Bacillus velezensis]|uniref:hypothetical protein n=1 Tax=Bacillus velezensis TaxID=492670 RepID=UPI0013D8D53A|nr:hypothetical protein [Bacillus velezensis]
MAKLLIEYEGTYDLKESVCKNKIMSGRTLVRDFVTYGLTLNENPKVNIKRVNDKGCVIQEINDVSLSISENENRQKILDNLAALLRKSL